MKTKKVKTRYRYSPAVVMETIFCALNLVSGFIILFFPVLTVKYLDGDVKTYSITGLETVSAALSGFGISLPGGISIGAPTGFFQILNQDFSSVTNPIVVALKQFFPFIILALAAILVIPMFFSLLQVFCVLKYALTGKSKKFKGPMNLAKSQFFTALTATVVFLIFRLLFQEMVNAIYPGSKVEQGIFIYGWLAIAFVLWIIHVIMHKILKDSVFVSRGKEETPAPKSKKSSKKAPSKKAPEPVEETPAPAPNPTVEGNPNLQNPQNTSEEA